MAAAKDTNGTKLVALTGICNQTEHGSKIVPIGEEFICRDDYAAEQLVAEGSAAKPQSKEAKAAKAGASDDDAE